jgi:hypothetical protein
MGAMARAVIIDFGRSHGFFPLQDHASWHVKWYIYSKLLDFLQTPVIQHVGISQPFKQANVALPIQGKISVVSHLAVLQA